MSLTVKAFYLKDGNQEEIRRFAVDEGVSSSYSYLKSKVQQVFSSLGGENFDLYWKEKSDCDDLSLCQRQIKSLSVCRKRKSASIISSDSEDNDTFHCHKKLRMKNELDADDDKILFTTDDELTEALGFVNDGVFRIYIRKRQGSSAANEGAEHPGVVCDGCNRSICGTRFKCLECRDYDLCAECESRGDHSEHRMLRLRLPGMQPWGFEQVCGIFPPGPGGPRHPPPPHHEPHGPHHPPPPPYGGPWGPGMMPFRKMMKRCWKQWMRSNMWGAQGGAGACGQTPDTPGEEGCRFREPKCDDNGTSGASSMNTDDGKEEKAQEACGGAEGVQEDYLRNVGESVAAMLDPLGISVDIDVEHHGKRKRCHGGRGRGRGGRGGWGGHWGAGPWAGHWGPAGPWAAFWQGLGGPHANQSGAGPSTSDCHATGAPEAKRREAEGEQAEATKEPEAPRQAPADAPVSSPAPGDVQMHSPGSAAANEEDEDWTMLQKEAKRPDTMEADAPSSPAAPRAREEPAASERPPFQLYPSVQACHPDRKVQDALQQLLAMGFNNEGGWLVSLLEAKNGDINKVLDALKPHRPQ